MLIVVGGHSRNVGKTSVIAALIRSVPELNWTAVKITGHHTHTGSGSPDSDTSRYRAAGAAQAVLLVAGPEDSAAILPALRKITDTAPNVIVESNRILEFIRPDLYLFVVDFGVAEFKASARRYLDRVSAFVNIDRGAVRPPSTGSLPLAAVPCFTVTPPYFTSPELISFVRSRA